MTQRYSHAIAVDHNYTGDFASIEEALADFRKEYPESEFAYIGVRNDLSAADLISVDSVVEDLQQRAYDEAGEISEDWLTHVSEDQKKELQTLLEGWVEQHHPIKFWQVDHIREYVATTGHDNGPV